MRYAIRNQKKIANAHGEAFLKTLIGAVKRYFDIGKLDIEYSDRWKYNTICVPNADPKSGVGEFRYYCCPDGMIGVDELPPNWGLLYESNGVIAVAKEAEQQLADYRSEKMILGSIMRRQGVKPQLFYTKNADYENEN